MKSIILKYKSKTQYKSTYLLQSKNQLNWVHKFLGFQWNSDTRKLFLFILIYLKAKENIEIYNSTYKSPS